MSRPRHADQDASACASPQADVRTRAVGSSRDIISTILDRHYQAKQGYRKIRPFAAAPACAGELQWRSVEVSADVNYCNGAGHYASHQTGGQKNEFP